MPDDDIPPAHPSVHALTPSLLRLSPLPPQDRLHPSSASLAPEVPVAILYATVGSESFKAFHGELSKLASEGSVRYALRHSWHGWHSDKAAGDCSGKEEMRLQGYAVELAVKNMEYKAVDDTKVDAQGQAVEDGEDAGEVGGFDFGVLIKRKPEIKDALLGFRDSLQTELSKGEEIKVGNQWIPHTYTRKALMPSNSTSAT